MMQSCGCKNTVKLLTRIGLLKVVFRILDPNANRVSVLGEQLGDDRRNYQGTNSDTVSTYYSKPNITIVAPAPGSTPGPPLKAYGRNDSDQGSLFSALKPIVYLLKFIGIYPIVQSPGGLFRIETKWIIYSVVLLLWIIGYIGYIKWDRIEIAGRSAEGRFEEAVIDYMFTVYLLPVVMSPITLYEAKKHAGLMNDMMDFEMFYAKVTGKPFRLFMGNKPLMIAIALPIVACGTMVVTHITMVNFRIQQVIPYCYINTVTYLIAGAWFLYCDVIGKTALVISDDFQQALKQIGPASMVADYRALWMLLGKIAKTTAHAFGYTLIFLCLYLFLIITLTVYGLLSQIQGGMSLKDVGLTITAIFATINLYFICDEAHYTSNCVKVQFQKRLLLVDLTWMNDDAQQEISMFLRATEMNPTDMSLVGFFDVNRTLFKSLLATMVTYLVVLLQFQISIPEERVDTALTNVTTAVPPAT